MTCAHHRAAALLLLLLASSLPAAAADDPAVARGKYLYDAADCSGCHAGETDAGAPSGGRKLDTPFGLFHAPNITPDRTHGIGAWSEADFRRAVREGIAPGGRSLYPVFPFPSFSGLSDGDIGDLYAYLMSLPAIPRENKPHALPAPFAWRSLMIGWRMLFFSPGPLQADPANSAEWNRGQYLAHAVAHCGECHTPRNYFGALKPSRAFSGNIGGPDGQNAPNITQDADSGIGPWSVEEIAHLLKTGETPDYDAVGSGMKQVVRGTAKLTDADRRALATYIKSLPAIRTPPPPKPGS